MHIIVALVISFYIVHFQTAHAFPPAPIPQTGQTTCWNTASTAIPCADTGQDGDKQNGMPWSNLRFTDNSNGTVTDNLTGLVWLKNANCFGNQQWSTAVGLARALVNGQWEINS